MKSINKQGKKMGVIVSETVYNLVKEVSDTKKIPMTQILGYFIDKQYSIDKDGFLDFSCTFPKDYEGEQFSTEGGKILRYMSSKKVMSSYLFLYLLRHEMGVSDGLVFAHAFKELLDRNFIETYKPGKKVLETWGKDTVYYRVVESETNSSNDEYEELQRLAKKFGKEFK